MRLVKLREYNVAVKQPVYDSTKQRIKDVGLMTATSSTFYVSHRMQMRCREINAVGWPPWRIRGLGRHLESPYAKKSNGTSNARPAPGFPAPDLQGLSEKGQ